MGTITLYDTRQICIHYMSALINGDYSGLNGDDEKLVYKWLLEFDESVWFDYRGEQEPYFGRDDISGLMADVIDVDIYLQQLD